MKLKKNLSVTIAIIVSGKNHELMLKLVHESFRTQLHTVSKIPLETSKPS